MHSSDPVISCEQLAKAYFPSASPGRLVLRAIREGCSLRARERARERASKEEGVHALRPLDLSIRRGESVGIIGRNGSGKSTLLQLISGVLRPSAGRVILEGRVAALLELGSGFDPDFTGRENVYFAASLLGFSEAEITAAYPEIEQFAGIGEFIERPVRSYSSGMALRLAFSVYTMVCPDILIIDEALAVGDEGFQRKCYRRLETLREKGTTLLFVSHSSAAVVQLCDRVIWFETGRLIADGVPKVVLDAYHRFSHLSVDEREPFITNVQRDGSIACAQDGDSPDENTGGESSSNFDPSLVPESRDPYPSRGCEIRNFRIIDQNGRPVNLLECNQKAKFVFEVTFQEDCYGVFFAMFIRGLNGTELGGRVEPSLSGRLPEVKSGTVCDVEFTFQCALTQGVYFINAGVEKLVGEDSIFAHRVVDAVLFRVLPEPESAKTGIIDFQIKPKVNFIQPDA